MSVKPSGHHFDVVVVGAGHNGLIAAAYLARAGLRTAIVERRTITGGACVTEEIAGAPGYRVSTGAAQVGNLLPRIIADLELGKHGFELLLPDPLTVFPYADGGHLAIWRDRARTLEEVRKFSRHDARAIPGFVSECSAACEIIEPLLYRDNPVTRDEIERAFSAAGEPGLFRDYVQGSAAELLGRHFESEQVKAALGFTSTFGTNAGPSAAGTAYVLLHHLFGATSGARGVAGYVRGGMGGLATALESAAAAAGAEIHAGVCVERILVQDNRAAGVVSTDGDEWYADAIVSGTDPVVTFTQLLEHEQVPEALALSLGKIQNRGVAAKVNCALDALPHFEQLPNALVPARVSIAPSLGYIEDAWTDTHGGSGSRAPFMTVHMQSVIDASLAPRGRHTLTCYAQYFPYTKHLSAASAAHERTEIQTRVLATLADFAPDIHARITACEVMSAFDLERRFGMTGGHQFHGDMLADQLFERRPVPGCSGSRTPIDGLYLCGAGTHPGGCIWGAPGQLAANAVMRDRMAAQRSP